MLCLLDRMDYGPNVDKYSVYSIVKHLMRIGYTTLSIDEWKGVAALILPATTSSSTFLNYFPADDRFISSSLPPKRLLAREINIETTSDYLQDLRNVELKLIDISFKDRNILREDIVKTYKATEILPLGSYTPNDVEVNRGTGMYGQLAPRENRSLDWHCQRDWYDCQGPSNNLKT